MTGTEPIPPSDAAGRRGPDVPASYAAPAVAVAPRQGPAGHLRVWLDRFGPLIGLAFVFALFSALSGPLFYRPANLELMLLHTAVVITAGLGMTMVIISGGIDLSVGSNVALCTVVVAALLRAGAPPLLAAAAGVGCGATVGLVAGGLIAGLRLPPFIVTLGLLAALRGRALGIADDGTITTPATWLNHLLAVPDQDHRWMLVAPGLWLTLLLAAGVAGVLRYTRFGRHVFAVGSNEQTARLCGVHVGRTKVAVYVAAGALVGFAGVLQYAYMTIGDSTTAPGMELDVIAAVVIGGASLSGGVGTVTGTITGALLMTVLSNGCTKLGLRNSVQMEVTGGIIIAAAALDRLRHRGRGGDA
jgi:ribose transport system permease protein